ncbi:P1 family peptidase [soil metagenome]
MAKYWSDRMIQERTRFRDLTGRGIGALPTGPVNAITDVAGVEVGHVTVFHGEPPGSPGQGPARTGVTVIWPGHRDVFERPVPAGTHVLAGTGEIICMTEIDELGMLASPILLTNSMQIGSVYDATARYMMRRNPAIARTTHVVMPVVGECDDSFLNDSRGMHVQPDHVHEALDSASNGWVEEGAVGAGTGMICMGFKGGIGTSSRVVEIGEDAYTVGVLVMTNYGRRRRLTIGGRLIGPDLPDLLPEIGAAPPPGGRHGEGSAIVVAATDAPLTGHQLARLAKRAAFGLVRVGSAGGNGSGELALAFSTAYTLNESPHYSVNLLNNFVTDELFEAAVDAAEEAIINSMGVATTTVGRDGNTVHALPLDRLAELLG